MRILILEDEKAATSQLVQALKVLAPDAEITGIFETVRDASNWLKQNQVPDLIISDIQLADGISLDLFHQQNLNIPVIFITAYDRYTLKAFKLNSIDYLLKPIDIDELKAALKKFNTIKNNSSSTFNNSISKLLDQINSRFRSRFLVKYKDNLLIIPVEDIAYFYADNRIVLLYTTQGVKHIVDESLDDLIKVLDPEKFFRINRQYITPLQSIDKISTHFNGKLKISLKNCKDTDIYISRDKAATFKNWIAGENIF